MVRMPTGVAAGARFAGLAGVVDPEAVKAGQGRVGGLRALRAEPAHQALGRDADHRRGDEEGFDAHVEKARDGAERIVGMQGAEDQVAGQRRLDGDLRGLGVADLADHDDIRVLAQDRAQAAGERQLDLGVHLDLANAAQLVLDRILDRDDVLFDGIDLGQHRIKRRRLAAAGRPGDEDDAVTLARQPAHGFEIASYQPQFLQAEDVGAAVEQAHDDAFAEGRRQGGDADVDFAAAHAGADAAVLGQAAFGDVHRRHHLDARDQRGMHAAWRREHLDEQAVDAEADRRVALEGFDVDVGGAVLGGLEDDRVHQADDRRFVVGLEEVGSLGQFGGAGGQRRGFLDLGCQRPAHRGGAVESAVDAFGEQGRGNHHRFDFAAVENLQVVDRAGGHGVAGGDFQDAVGQVQRQDVVAPAVLHRDRFEQFWRDGRPIEAIDGDQPQAVGEYRCPAGRCEPGLGFQGRGQLSAVAGPRPGPRQRIGGDPFSSQAFFESVVLLHAASGLSRSPGDGCGGSASS
jgi:hypothetical protein